MKSNPAIADSHQLIKLRYGAKELSHFPKLQARQILAGGHRSHFRGRGMDFDQVRLYQPGDDVRSIDWRVTARTQVPHTKVFIEERERPILIICDLRSSMFFGSQRLKSVVACEVSAALAWAGLGINDRVGHLQHEGLGQHQVETPGTEILPGIGIRTQGLGDFPLCLRGRLCHGKSCRWHP